MEECEPVLSAILGYADKRFSTDHGSRYDLVAFVQVIGVYLSCTNNQVYRTKLLSEAIFLLKSIKDKLDRSSAESQFYIQGAKGVFSSEFADQAASQEEVYSADLSALLYNKNVGARTFNFILAQLATIIGELIDCGQYSAADKLCEVLQSVAETVKSLPYLIKCYRYVYRIRGSAHLVVHASLSGYFDLAPELFGKPSIQEVMRGYKEELVQMHGGNSKEAIEWIAKYGFCVALDRIKLEGSLPLNFLMPLFYAFSIKPVVDAAKRPISYFKYLIIGKLNEAPQVCPLFLSYYNPKAAASAGKLSLETFAAEPKSMGAGIEALLRNLAYALNAHSRKYRRFIYCYVLFRIANSFHEFCFRQQKADKDVQFVHMSNYAALFFGLFRYGLTYDFIDAAQDAQAYFLSAWVALGNLGPDAASRVPEHSCQFCTAGESVEPQLSALGYMAYYVNANFRFKYCYKKTFVSENEKSGVRKTLKRISIKFASSVPEISHNSILLKLKSRKGMAATFLASNAKWMTLGAISKPAESIVLGAFEWIFDVNKRLTYVLFYHFSDAARCCMEVCQNPVLTVG